MSNTYCPFIYHQQMVDFHGKVSACCQFEASSNYEQYDQMMEPFRQAMERGEKIKPCRRCWQDEENGLPSLRQSAITDFKRYKDHAGLMILDIRINNNCNLACTMCSEHASSLWGKLIGSNYYPRLDNELQDKLINNSDKMLKLSIQGGEPFYGDDFINFVEKLQNKHNMQLEIFSNTITANADILKKWCQEFKQVMFISSVDGIEETFESIRWPAKWNKFEKKILEIYDIKQLGVNFNFTVQNLNMLNIENFVNWRNKTVPRYTITFSVLEWPAYFQFFVLTEEEKNQAVKMIDNINTPYGYEKNVLLAIREQLLLKSYDQELLIAKQKRLAEIEQIREKYLVRPERLELSTPSTSS